MGSAPAMPLEDTIFVPYRNVTAYVPSDVVRFHSAGSLFSHSLLCTSDLATAQREVNKGRIVTLAGNYRQVLDQSASHRRSEEETLRSVTRLSPPITVLCSRTRVLDLSNAPPITGTKLITSVPPNWYNAHYLLPVAQFADLRLRAIYARSGIILPGIPEPLLVRQGVFVPDGALVVNFLHITK